MPEGIIGKSTYAVADTDEVVDINNLVLVVHQVHVGHVRDAGSGRRASGGQLLLLICLLGAGHCSLMCR